MSQEPIRPVPSGPAPSRAPDGLEALAARLRALPPSCGPVRLIAVDGHAGSGKSTFARHLAAALDDAPVVQLDDIATHDELFAWADRFRAEVLAPLSRGEPARYRVYDWERREFTARRELVPAYAVIVEGVGAGRRALRPYLACLLWMDLTAGHSWERGRLRDGQALEGFWDDWIPAERGHFAADPTRPHAGLLVRASTEGYEVLPGPDGTHGTP
ncbi:uridine kinase [Streptomyces rimosus]|uniref:uridine kinase n=1 Tax=Streptomyces rimosus TaxID=1927 RepID=UPI003788E161